MKNKKGQLGMDVAKSFMLGLMTLLVVGVTLLIVLNALEDTSLIEPDTLAGTVTNETGAYINGTTYTVDESSAQGFSTFAVTSVINVSDNVTIGSGNYTVDSSAGTIVGAASRTDNYSSVLVSYTYNYEQASDEQNVVTNGTDSVATFFTNTSTWLALLGVVIIILIIAVVIAVVNRFDRGAI